MVALAACDDPKPAASTTTAAATATASAAMTATASASAAMPSMPAAPPLPASPSSLPEAKAPADNPITAEKVALGKQLFFDKRLSKDGSASCETCHVPEKGWTDGSALSKKVGGGMNTRHSPTLYNVAYNPNYYWDGRSPTLEKQIEAAWKGQMGASPADVSAALAKVPGYAVQFKTIFKRDPMPDDVIAAIASFVRTIKSGDSPWDRYEKGDKTAVSEEAVRGHGLFAGKGACATCHTPPLYTDLSFHNVGIGFDKPEPDLGRGKISKDEKENGAFKTPSLRSVSTHPPYFHDGRAASLDDAVDYMLSGGTKAKNPTQDAKLQAIKLSPKERTDLIAFLKSLEAPAPAFERPKLP